ncbi:MAG: LacI family DNA-binding transcriptional regulator [Terriglobales bacterium]|jgi:LacI family transcriptional regulator|nr:LacI family DNA-binding transcriptional regulator [Terriglobales bacterium]
MTIKEIAKRAKVSIGTVSRTINRIPTVNPVLARRVWRVIEEVDYYPNSHAKTLVSGRSRIFGLIVPEINNPFFPEIVQTFMELGVKHQYEILLRFLAQDESLLENAARQMIGHRVDGVAILTFGREDALIAIFARQNVPVFVVDMESPEPLVKSVHINYEHGIRQAVQHLAALGHLRIALVSGPGHLKTVVQRKAAFLKCMNEIGLPTPPQLLIEGDHSMSAGMTAISTLAALPDRPTAVVCSNDMTAIGVMRQAFELALDVPRDLSVVGFEDIRLAQFMIPPLTTVQLSQIEIADIAFKALLDSAEAPYDGYWCSECTIKTELVLRHSTALAPGRLRQSGCQSPNIRASARP